MRVVAFVGGRGFFGGTPLPADARSAVSVLSVERQVIQREISVLATLNTPHVVSYIASYTQNATLTIVMEYLSHGSVRDLLDALPGRALPEEIIAAILAPLAAGLAYVHGAAKLHRDVKAANVLLGGSGEVKLADFGVAGTLTATLKQRNTFVGSTYWMAPEVVSEDFYAEKVRARQRGTRGERDMAFRWGEGRGCCSRAGEGYGAWGAAGGAYCARSVACLFE